MPKETFFNLSEEKQEKVIRSAISEFMKHGFEKANVGNIAKNAGVAKGSMYQYFENKKELFIYSVHWTVGVFINKNSKEIINGNISIFDYFYQSSGMVLQQIREERELTVFMQDVFLGKYHDLVDESIKAMLDASNDMLMALIREGKKNGSIRKDINDKTLSLFLVGASMKIKENMLSRIRDAGADIADANVEMYMEDIRDMMELLKNGMGEKTCLST